MRSWFDVPVNSVLLGQLLSLAVTVTGTVSTALAQLGASVPFTQSASNYALLCIVFGGPARLFKWNWEQKAWKYGLLAGIDVVSTWCVVKAFSLTSLTSVTLLDSWSIPCVILLTAVCFKQRYSAKQVLSAALAVSGLATLLLFDNSSSAGPQSVTLQGDVLVIIGATGYGINNVLSEHILKSGDPTEFLAGLGTFGLLASCITMPLFEWRELAEAPWNPEMFLLLNAYAVAMLLFSLGMPVLLHKSGSTFFNLSLLTSDFYAFAARAMLLQGFTRSSLTVYVISTTLVVIGLVLYFTSPHEPAPTAPLEGPPSTRPAQPLHTSAASHPVSESFGSLDDVVYAIPAVFPAAHAARTPRSPRAPKTPQSAPTQVHGAHSTPSKDYHSQISIAGDSGDQIPLHSTKNDGIQGSQPRTDSCFSSSPCHDSCSVVDVRKGSSSPSLGDEKMQSCSHGIQPLVDDGLQGKASGQVALGAPMEYDRSSNTQGDTGCTVHSPREHDATTWQEYDQRVEHEEERDGGEQIALLRHQDSLNQ